MIYQLGGTPENCGRKAYILARLKKNGLNVPEAMVISSDSLSHYTDLPELQEISARLTADNAASISSEIMALLDEKSLPEFSDIPDIDETGLYAVRSSASLEDMTGMSFAGQYETVLNVTYDHIPAAIDTCCRSMYAPTVLSYLASNGISIRQLRMSVIIQKMIKSEKSGVVFTLNPITGCDREIAVEIIQGLGEELVNGRTSPERHVFGWYGDPPQDGKLLSAKELSEIRSNALHIARLLGYPCDIEFAFSGGILHILQARPITRIMYSGIADQWTTADFKDGGVSATVCMPYMWSLYEFIWESELKNFMLESKILKSSQLRKLGEMFYSRPYWNLSVVKTAMSMVPGYKEREFDNEFGIEPSYEGDGQTTSVTPKTLIGIIKMAIAQKKIVRERRKKASMLKSSLLSRYNTYLEQKDCIFSQREIEQLWLKLIREDYFKSESIYFRQIYINTIHQSLYKGKILRHTDEAGYLRLIGGLDNISHLLPFYAMWDISRAINRDENALKYWSEHTPEQIRTAYDNGKTDSALDRLREFIAEFGYHSKKELDVAYPCFDEDVTEVIFQLRETVFIGDEYAPQEDRDRLSAAYQRELERLPAKTRRIVSDMRTMLWWREEFRDISTRFYHIIRLFTIKLAEVWTDAGIIPCKEDIWYLKIDDIERFIHKEANVPMLRRAILKNREYYDIYRNFNSENEIGKAFPGMNSLEDNKKAELRGLGCSCGEVEGTARIITDIADIDKIRCGDILVTKYTDTGWTSKFAMLKGIVTEYGGMLCHAAIVSREYGIAGVVCVANATRKITDGARIRINGESGEITLLDSKEI